MMRYAIFILLIPVFMPGFNFGQGAGVPGSKGSFTCGDKVTHILDGKVYGTVLIGSQCWMRENLNAGRLIPVSRMQTDNSVIEKYCYDDLEENCDVYGGLYQWNEAMQYTLQPGAQGICPEGWHIPAEGDWEELVRFLGGEVAAGESLKEAGLNHFMEPNIGAANRSGFTALPGGYSYATGKTIFGNLHKVGYFWSSTPDNETDVWFRSMGYNDPKIHRHVNYKTTGASLRCLKDRQP